MSKSNSILDISDILEEYSEDIQEAITEKAEEVAEIGKDKLRSSSPKNKRNSSRRGKYAKGWRVKTIKGKGFVSCIIHNATDYQLTHLLENAHLTRKGTLTTPQKHITPVHDECCENFEKGVEKIVKNGG